MQNGSNPCRKKLIFLMVPSYSNVQNTISVFIRLSGISSLTTNSPARPYSPPETDYPGYNVLREQEPFINDREEGATEETALIGENVITQPPPRNTPSPEHQPGTNHFTRCCML
jgi:hypothetical protein